MDLREKIAEVLYEAPASDGALAKIACDVALRRAQRRADAVMGVVEEETRRQHQDAKCVPYGAYQRVCGLLTEAEAEAGAANARVRELEDENQRMREIIADQIFAAEQECQAAIVKNPTSASLNGHLVGLQRARDIALSRARDIAGQATVAPSPRNPRKVQ